MDSTSKPSYRDLLGERQFLKNLVATAISRFGDSVDAIAFIWLVCAISGSTALTATTFGVNRLWRPLSSLRALRFIPGSLPKRSIPRPCP